MAQRVPDNVPKVASTWFSHRLEREILCVRYGTRGTPVLLFPTAGGDAEESERFWMIHALRDLLGAGRIRVYTVDSAAGKVWTDGTSSGAHRAWFQNRFDDYIASEVVPLMRKDAAAQGGGASAEIIAAGASLGAFNALAAVCRHPDAFKEAICMSGTYDFSRWMGGQHTVDFHYASPIHFMPSIPEGAGLAAIRRRFVLLATGNGAYEAPAESWNVARILGARGVPNRVDVWDGYRHDWTTWREMLPKYLAERTV